MEKEGNRMEDISITIEHKKHGIFERFSTAVAKAAGSNSAFIIAVLLVLVWLITGPMFNYSETWQLIINTGTTIITFLMVFLIQKVQNKDSMAIHLKLNELVAANEAASNRLVYVEGLSEEEMVVIQKYYLKLNELTKHGGNLHESHSVDEAEYNVAKKNERNRRREQQEKKAEKKEEDPK